MDKTYWELLTTLEPRSIAGCTNVHFGLQNFCPVLNIEPALAISTLQLDVIRLKFLGWHKSGKSDLKIILARLGSLSKLSSALGDKHFVSKNLP